MCEICDGKSPAQVRREMRAVIERYGWALQYVESAIDESGVHPAYCYSVGLTGFGSPEVIVTGRVAEQSAAVLDELGYRARCGDDLRPGQQHSVGGLEVTLVDVERPRHWLRGAVDFYGLGFTALQAVWADCRGLFPWQAEPGSTIVQPLLGRPPAVGA